MFARKLLIALFAALLAAHAAAETLVMRDGSLVETPSGYQVKGRQVVFKNELGRLVALQVADVDFEATRKLVEDRARQQAADAEARRLAAEKARIPVLTLTNDDVKASAGVGQLTIPGRGALFFERPAATQMEIRGEGGVAPTLVLTAEKGEAKLLTTVLWSPTSDPTFNTKSRLKALAEDMARDKPLRRVEANVEVHELEGAQGYWFWMTDPAPKAGEYEYAATIVSGTGSLLLTSTILTHEQPPAGVQVFLQVVRSMKHQS